MGRVWTDRIRGAGRDLAKGLGLTRCGAFYGDWLFVAAAAVGVGFWALLWLLLPVRPMPLRQAASWPFLSLAIVQPCLEEVVFRGFLQGQLRRWRCMQAAWHGLTAANAATALLFTAGHFVSHPALWAAGVILPALVFGFFRDRYASIWPGAVLHGFYNAGYFTLTGIPGL